MVRPFHIQVPHHRDDGERPHHRAGALLLILVLAALALVWREFPPVASLLPTHPPG